jgi:hypothetical protein
MIIFVMVEKVWLKPQHGEFFKTDMWLAGGRGLAVECNGGS